MALTRTAPWYLDETAHAGPEHLDGEYVAAYDRKAGVDPAGELTLLRELGLSPASVLVDLGTGTGTLAVAAAPLCRRVVAVDVSPAMLAAVQRKVEALGLCNLELVQAGLLSYAHGGAAADFVYARHCFHQVPDFWKAIALRRIWTMLRPGGFLRVRDLLLGCEIDEVTDVVTAWLHGAADQPTVGWTRSELETHLREEHSTFTWLFEPMLERAGFEIMAAEFSPTRTHASYTCVRSP